MKIIKHIAIGFCFVVFAPIAGVYIAVKWLYEVAKIIIFNKDGFVDDVLDIVDIMLIPAYIVAGAVVYAPYEIARKGYAELVKFFKKGKELI